MTRLFAMSVLSLNLHGYHPMGEAPRLRQDRAGKLTETTSDVYYFSREELERGHRRRLDALAKDLANLRPTFAFLQEVGAGAPESRKDCAEFESTGDDAFSRNAALRLQSRLKAKGLDYQVRLACRGNVGWTTSRETFRDERIVRRGAGGRLEVVHEFDSNPYPAGVLVEGFALLVAPGWRIEHQATVRVEVNGLHQDFLFQEALVRDAAGKSLLLINVHAAHKLSHFEQAVAVREHLARRWGASPPGAVIVAGDFNAQLYRPLNPSGEIATAPWEVRREGEFDFTPAEAQDDLKRELTALNDNREYKAWATIENHDEAAWRIDTSVAKFFALPEAARAPMTEALSLFHPPAAVPPERESRGIDHIFFTPGALRAREARFLWDDVNTWRSLEGVSDHPGAWAVFE